MFITKGIIDQIFDTNHDTGFREFWLEYEVKRKSEFIRLSLKDIGCQLLDNVSTGARVEVEFYISGNKREGKALINNNNVTKFKLI